MFDLVLSGGRVLDGSGAPARTVDVGIEAGRITALADLSPAPAAMRLDVSGLTVIPGLIDTHQHSDLTGLLPASEVDLRLANVRQGVTTEVCGNCGFSPFPCEPHTSEFVQRHVSGILGPSARAFASLTDYQAALSQLPLPINLAPLVGHGSLRTAVAGYARRRLTSDEHAAMVRLCESAFTDGAFGVSSGLIYVPGVYADTEELVAVARVAARHGRPYVSHIRDEMAAVDAAIDEAVAIGRCSGAALHVSHHKVAGRANWGRTANTLARLNAAAASGLDLSADVYPYTAGSTVLRALLPPWVQADGVDVLLERLVDRAVRDQLDREFVEGLPHWQNLVPARPAWADVVIANSPSHPHWEGQSIAALANGGRTIDVVAEVLRADDGTTNAVIHMMCDDDVDAVLSQPFVTVGSDAIPVPGRPHPRVAGTFARVLHRFREEATLPDAIRRMTSAAAARFNIPDRGLLRIGAVADVAVIDPKVVADRASYDQPLLAPDGICHVLIDGVPVIRDAVDTGARPGAVLTPAASVGAAA